MASSQDDFKRIYEAAKSLLDADKLETFSELKTYATEEIEKSKASNPSIRDKTVHDYFQYTLEREGAEWRAKCKAPRPTAKDLWQAVGRYDPMAATPTSPLDDNELTPLIRSSRCGPVPLGRLRGEVSFAMFPAIGCPKPLESINKDWDIDFDPVPAPGFMGAIAYTEGHPSEEDFHLKVKSSDDTTLRRYFEIGWLIQVDRDGGWTRTGHVLVIDADHGRNKQPWIMLASEWPRDGDAPYDEDNLIYAEKRVKRNDRYVRGILPGDNNRTPIARLTPYGKATNTTEPTFEQFGANFEFDLERVGKAGRAEHSEWGPGLPDVMTWWLDPENEESGEEVCFNADGQVYMRFEPKTKQYSYPNAAIASFSVQTGEIGNQSPGPVPLSQRMCTSSFILHSTHRRCNSLPFRSTVISATCC